MEFDELVTILRKNKYKVKVQHYPEYKYAEVTGRNIKAGFCTKVDVVYTYLKNKIAADHRRCFDKWSKCPLNMSLDNLNGELLLKYLKYLGSPEGYENSNSYDYLDNNPYREEP